MKLQYEDICFLVNLLKKLDDEDASTLLSIVVQLIEKDSYRKSEG